MFFRDQITIFGRNRSSSAILAAVSLLLSGCGDTPTASVAVNQTDGIVLNPPEFLQSRAVDRSNLEARVSVNVDGRDIQVTQTSETSAPWVGQVFVPVGSNPTVAVTWVETGVSGMPADMQGELPLAVFNSPVGENIEDNQTFRINTGDYLTSSTEQFPLPLLDSDNDGFSNLQERQAGSRPADALDIPPNVTILYTDRSPVIDGRFDTVWETAQFQDQAGVGLNIDNVLINRENIAVVDDREMKWAGLHDGEFLYLLIFAERGIQQTPIADSPETLLYNDDSIDVYWDGDNSKGASYDGENDHHFIIGLLDDDGNENQSGLETTRMIFGDRSAPLDENTVEFAVCLCDGDQQIYEVKIALTPASIPIDSTFGFEININDDVDGQFRDAKWAWYNTTGEDNTWRFALLMGNARLENPPE